MNKFLLMLAVGTFTFFTACQDKQKPAEKTETKAPATSVAEKTADTLAVEIPATDTSATEAAPVAASESAAGRKFGHINSAELIKIMPETKRAEATLTAYVKTLEKQLGGLQSDYQNKIADYQSQEKTMVDAIKQTKIMAIQKLEMQMQESQAAGQEKIAAKREALFKPILDKAEKAIKDVAKENGYDYVFDTNSGAFIYSNESQDVMPLVKKKLGVK